MDKKQTNHRICAMFTIVDYGLYHKITDLYQRNHIPITLVTHGHGAANSEIYEILGFGESKKVILLNVLTEAMAGHMYEILNREMSFKKPGTGIAFTLPINGISSLVSQLCINTEQNQLKESEVVPMHHSEPYDMIIAIVNNGYFSEVMDTAKKGGATGGTLIHARGLQSEEAAKFLGITIQPEKDIVLILASHENKYKIMENITTELGLATAGNGICFSVPVSSAIGLGTHTL